MRATDKPILLVMAAGLGSRYGGLKQIAPVDGAGQILIDYSLYDARRAGFERVIFIVQPQLEKDFRETIGDRAAEYMEVKYVHQRLSDLPEGFALPEGRVKPWGTAHAVFSARELIDANFAVINADDFYGAEAFSAVYNFLNDGAGEKSHAMVGYEMVKTLTEHGSVSRGVCKTDSGKLVEVVERTKIEQRPGGGAYTEDGVNFTFLPDDTIVSMNMWGFGFSMMEEIKNRFPAFLTENLPLNPDKCEYFLPLVVNKMLSEGAAEVNVLPTKDRWFGITYPEDMPVVREALGRMRDEGKYPEFLWKK